METLSKTILDTGDRVEARLTVGALDPGAFGPVLKLLSVCQQARFNLYVCIKLTSG